MEISYRVATLNDVDDAYSVSEANFKPEVSEMERTMALWNVRWRKEALLHYFATGWSFVGLKGGRVTAYFMAQPFIHFRGQTQTVWVEHIEASDRATAVALVEIAVRVAREKHMQRVLFSEISPDLLSDWPTSLMADKILEVKTTKG